MVILEGQVGFEPTTSSLRGRRSTTELLARKFNTAYSSVAVRCTVP